MSAAAISAGAPATFVRSAQECFQRAASRSGGARQHIVRIGQDAVRLLFANERMEQLLFPALAHLEEPDPDGAALTACFFDSESTATPMPPPPWTADDYTNRGEIHGYNDGAVHVLYQPGVDILHCLDCRAGLAVYWAPTWRLIPYWERSFPLRTILNWWLKDGPFQPLHAGAVGFADGGVLVIGESGSGKTTTTLSCLDSPLLYAGDDYVFARTDPCSPYVYSLYNTAKLEPDNLSRFPQLRPYLVNGERLGPEKALFFLQQAMPERISRGFPIRAILRPHVTGLRDTRYRKARAVEAFLAIAPTTTRHLPGARRQTVEKLFRLSKAVPAYILEAGTDLRQIPAAIIDLLEQLRHGRLAVAERDCSRL